MNLCKENGVKNDVIDHNQRIRDQFSEGPIEKPCEVKVLTDDDNFV